MRKLFTLFVVILALQLQQKAFAQIRTITGTVVSSDNVPVSGATVLVKGTQKGTQTDAEGNFSIQASTGQVLEISFIGFQPAQVKVGSSSTVNVVLNARVSQWRIS